MSLTSGQSLSFYEILGPLGVGAMGEVYRAKDTRLEREVAIKVLPAHFAEDEERLRRFEREAKSLASLNHPNVAQIYGVDQIDDTCFLVLELVPGETLEERISRGALPVDEAVEVCRQIAEGLEAAHEAGVIHRDLKPANVRITPDGKVKVLDFGLAKPTGPDAGAESNTDSVLATETGRLLGTPTYMAPEQARGKPIDRRVDMWAFGCVLYECLTARRAFDGETIADVIASVLEESPDMTQLPVLPVRVRELLLRCLSKDPRVRLRDIGEARVLLEDPGAISGNDSPAVKADGRLPRAAMFLGVLGLLAAALWAGQFLWKPVAHPTTPTRFTLEDHIGDQGSWGGNLLAISNDARTIAYVGVPGDSRLHLRAMDSVEVRVVPDTDGAHAPFFSPDSKVVAYWSDGKLMKVPVEGGMPSLLTTTSRLHEASWGPDGRIAVVELGQLVSIDVRTGTREPMMTDTSDFVDSPCFLPDGERVLIDRAEGLTGGIGRPLEVRKLCVVQADGTWQALGQAGSNPNWSATGHIVFQGRDDTIWAAPFDPETLEFEGEAVQLVDRPVVDFDVALDGTLVYVPGLGRAMELVWVDRAGEATPLDFGMGHYMVPRLAPDDRRLAVSIQERSQDQTDLWVFELGRGARTRLTTDGDWNLWAVWTHGATRLSYMGGGYLWTRSADGTGEARRLMENDNRYEVPISWSEDEQALAYYAYGQGGDLRIWYADGGPEEYLATRFDERSPHFSPDGRWIAYVSDQSGVNEVYVRPHMRGEVPDSRFAVSTGGGGEPRWSRDGTELFYRHGSQMFSVSFEPGPPPVVGVPRLLFDRPYLTSPVGRSNPNYDVAADGRFLMIRISDSSETSAPVVHVVRGLVELAER